MHPQPPECRQPKLAAYTPLLAVNLRIGPASTPPLRILIYSFTDPHKRAMQIVQNEHLDPSMVPALTQIISEAKREALNPASVNPTNILRNKSMDRLPLESRQNIVRSKSQRGMIATADNNNTTTGQNNGAQTSRKAYPSHLSILESTALMSTHSDRRGQRAQNDSCVDNTERNECTGHSQIYKVLFDKLDSDGTGKIRSYDTFSSSLKPEIRQAIHLLLASRDPPNSFKSFDFKTFCQVMTESKLADKIKLDDL